MYNQLSSLYIQDDVLCCKFEPTNGRLAHLQQIVPPSLVTEIITSLDNSLTAGPLRAYKTLEKIRQRYYWPGVKTDVVHHILRCDKCQKRLALHRSTDIRSLIGILATRSIRLVSTSWVFYLLQTDVVTSY